MSIEQLNMNGKTKEEIAIERYQEFEKVALRMNETDGYYVAFSDGKDSIVIKKLAELAGVKFKAHYNITGIDPPELVYYMREYHKDVLVHQHEKSMFQLIEEKCIPPSRLARYCCEVLKEGGGEGQFVVTGVRWAESAKRKKNRHMVEFDKYGSASKEANNNRETFYLMNDNAEKRRMMESCTIKGKYILNPIIDWTDEEVWEFIRKYNVPYCKLYDEGFARLGCIGCPLAGEKHMKKEFKKYPKFKANYIRAFDRMLLNRHKKGLETSWKNGAEVMQWWMGNNA